MDSDGNGKGEFWIGADGWASANVNQVKLRDYGLYDAGIEPIRAAEAVKNARVLDSIKKGEGYAFYCYKPHAIWGMADVVMLEEPKFDPAKYKMVLCALVVPFNSLPAAWPFSIRITPNASVP